MSRSMFSRGGGGGGGDAPHPPSGHLLEQRAGHMTVTGNTVTADKRKGLIIIKKSDDGLVNFIWKDRTTNMEDDPIILFPDDAVMHKCKSCKDGRVYYLKFSGGRRDFFWMQEPDEKKDAVFCRRLNNIINGSGDDASASAADEITSIAQQLGETPAVSRVPRNDPSAATPAVTATPAVPPALVRQSNSRPAETPAPAAAATAAPGVPGRSAVQLDDSVLRGIMAGLAAQMPAVRQGQADGVDLADILKAEHIEPLLQEPDIVDRLRPFLPEGNNLTAQDVRENILSPQYAQALRSFSHALSTGQMDGVMAQFGVDAAAARAAGGGIVGLCKAILDKKNRMDES